VGMAARYLTEMLSADALDAQRVAYGRTGRVPEAAGVDVLGSDERDFITSRDSFFMATVTRSGWPYVQHRGGPPGFLRVLGENTLAFADLKGNRQLLSTGNLAAVDRVALFLIDYPQRVRLKIMGHARTVDAGADPALADRVSPSPELRARIERVFVIDVVGFDWNCPAYITPRYTAEEVEEVVAPLRARVAELEAQLAAERARR